MGSPEDLSVNLPVSMYEPAELPVFLPKENESESVCPKAGKHAINTRKMVRLMACSIAEKFQIKIGFITLT